MYVLVVQMFLGESNASGWRFFCLSLASLARIKATGNCGFLTTFRRHQITVRFDKRKCCWATDFPHLTLPVILHLTFSYVFTFLLPNAPSAYKDLLSFNFFELLFLALILWWLLVFTPSCQMTSRLNCVDHVKTVDDVWHRHRDFISQQALICWDTGASERKTWIRARLSNCRYQIAERERSQSARSCQRGCEMCTAFVSQPALIRFAGIWSTNSK